MSEAIRDVVIRVAIEQKNARLKPPDVSAATAAIESTMAKSAESINTLQQEYKQLEKSVGNVEASVSKQEKAAAAAYDKEAREAVRAYSRIMREREKAAKAAEQAAAREAKAAEAAAKKIEAERAREAKAAIAAQAALDRAAEQTAQKQEQLANQISSQKSAVLSAYGGMASSAMQAAKGVAFLVAANEEEAAALAKTVAAAQGYFDIVVGGMNFVKALNDAKRASAALSTAEAAAATLAGTANAGAAAAAGTAATAMLPMVGAIVGVTVAAYAGARALQYYGATTEESAEKAARKTVEASRRQVDALTAVADTAARLSALRLGRLSESDDQSLAQERDRIAQERAILERQLRQVEQLGARGDFADTLKQRVDLQERIQDSMEREQQVNDRLIEQEKAKSEIVRKNVEDAARELQLQKERFNSATQEVAMWNRADQARAKRIAAKIKEDEALGRQSTLTVQEAQFAAQKNILGGGAARERLARDVRERGLEGVNVDPNAVRRAESVLAGAVADERIITRQVDEAVKKIQDRDAALMENILRIASATDTNRSLMQQVASAADRLEKEFTLFREFRRANGL